MDAHMEIRVRRLEWANRILFLVVFAAAFYFAIGPSWQDGGAGPIRSQRIELIDAEGSVQVVLGSDAEGATGLFIYDPEGIVRLSLSHDPSQSALFINDAQGTVRIGAAQFAHGGGGVALHGAESKGATVLYHKETGSLRIYDKQGRTTANFPPDEP